MININLRQCVVKVNIILIEFHKDKQQVFKGLQEIAFDKSTPYTKSWFTITKNPRYN